ncbi:MAG: o-succinylbenzoate synthase [Theionarchaea archaeon]|nr:o-succinylbenzoate synthase [Theionarchaea archaeon]MBU7037967.1 o-succinylbenzoate synthase [Theionarchaea archaeon]
MKIKAIELRVVEIPYIYPFETSFGREERNQEIIVHLCSEEMEGFGECVALDKPSYSYETVNTEWHILEDFIIPEMESREFETPDDLQGIFKRIRGHPMAKAGIEEALYDLYATQKGVSLSRVLGGNKSTIESGVSIGIDKMETLLKNVAEKWAEGYKRIKVKIKPGWDVQVVKRIRKEMGDIPLMVDANAAYTLADMDIMKELDQYGLMMIEQPLGYDDLYDHAVLQKELATPLCLDESIESVRDAEIALKMGSCKIINIKHGRVGGLTASRKIHDLCMKNKVPVWAGGMLEFGIGRATNIALSSLPGFCLPNDISATDRYYHQDITDPFMLNPDGTITVPEGPGIGVHVHDDVVEKFTVRRKEFRF